MFDGNRLVRVASMFDPLAAIGGLTYRSSRVLNTDVAALDRRLAMPIRSLRTIVANKPPITAPKTATVREASRTMKQHNIGAVLVVDGSRLCGIFTERDALFRVLAGGLDPDATQLSEVMTSQPQTIHPDEPFVNALRVMHKGRFRHLPVVEFDRPLGMVSVRDALDGDLYALHEALEQQEDSLY
jgi:CBS domain-containing protein